MRRVCREVLGMRMRLAALHGSKLMVDSGGELYSDSNFLQCRHASFAPNTLSKVVRR